jgi:hypothetical protein
LAFVADPQLVDPHTYPGRPWPLSTLTVRYTDLYLWRVYSLLQQRLYPDTTIFLGDLFDGGREWSTETVPNPDERWKKYGEKFWLKEYMRFSRIFFDPWIDAGVYRHQDPVRRRKLLSNLPGNHDLGFATGIQKAVKNRFNAYFGEGNRVDIVGNHTFVSLDTVSLSAKEYADSDPEIWQTASDFLASIQDTTRKALNSELKIRQGLNPNPVYRHAIYQEDGLGESRLQQPNLQDVAQLPTVLLTHVPLYRDRGTPCGPHREHWPPTLDGSGKPLEYDERNALQVAAGYQYQNVLTLDLSKEITERIGNVHYAFSGDDHDYCEVLHHAYPSAGSGIHEITVKSLSWAMGIRRPGFVMLSMWNPIDELGNSLRSGHGDTIQTHLCLLPDQLAIFIRYGVLLVFTLSLLLLRAGRYSLNPSKSAFAGSESPLLPVMREPLSSEMEKAESSCSDDGSGKSSLSLEHHGLSARSLNSRARSVSPKKGGYGLPAPLIERAGYYGPTREDKEEVIDTKIKSKPRRLKGLKLFYTEFQWSIIKVSFPVLAWYIWLVWTG